MTDFKMENQFDSTLLGAKAGDVNRGKSGGYLSRRRFFLITGMSGLAIGFTGISSRTNAETENGANQEINHYVQIDVEGNVVIFTPEPETGQGVRTSLPMIVAEEMDADWGRVIVKSAVVDQKRYGLQAAFGSTSVLKRWPELRKMGAMARVMMINAAAQRLQVDPTELTTANSEVIHKASGRRISYGDLAVNAASQSLPDETSISYKRSDDYRILGKRIGNIDNKAIVTGSPLFGIDIQVPNMLYATYVKSPAIGGRPKSANLKAIKNLPGVIDAFIIEGTRDIPTFDPASNFVSSGVAIIAKSTWQAFKARKSLRVEWDLSAASTDDSEMIKQHAAALSGNPTGDQILVDKGDVDKIFADSKRIVESYYTADFASHAQLEPQNCTVHFKGDSVEAWAPTQTPTGTVIGLAKMLGLPPERVKVHQIRGGGGFGRRLENDYAREAALISKKVAAPIKLQWMREDDMAFDYFRPPMYNVFKASLDKNGALEAWSNHNIAVSTDGKTPSDQATVPKLPFPELSLDHYRLSNSLVLSKTPTGAMRAPRSNTYAFMEQSFVHELAVKSGRDHLEFLIESLGKPRWTKPGDPRALNTERAINTLRQVAINADWGREMSAGRALGLSFFFSHSTHVAEIADVSVDKNKQVKVHKVWVVADIGPVINLSGAEGQCQGSVIDALSTLAQQRISIKEGRVQQTNFHEYPLLRTSQRPDIEVEFLQSDYAPTGMGEPALPPLAAAVCNAIYTVTGERVRNLPINQHGFSVI